MTRLGIITGLPAEARCLMAAQGTRQAGLHASIACAGPGPERAAAEARRLIGEGVQAIASFGIAGGLDPALASGAVVVATRIWHPQEGWIETDQPWRERLIEAIGGGAASLPLAGADRPVEGVAEKRALFADCAAAAVDMESHAVALEASRSGIPVLGLRAVADPAGRALPASALAGLGAAGQASILGLVGELMKRPAELPAVLALMGDFRRALRALRRVAALAPALALQPGERLLDM